MDIKNVFNFWRTNKLSSTQTQALDGGDIDNHDMDYDCGITSFESTKEELTEGLVNSMYQRVFADAVTETKINGVSDSLINSGVFFDYFYDYVKSKGDYKLYVKRVGSNIIAMNKSKVDETFEEVIIKEGFKKTKYSATLLTYSQLANYILQNIKNGDLANFLTFKKVGFNTMFDITTNQIGGEEYANMVETKTKQLETQLSNIQEALSNKGKSSIMMIDKEDNIELIKIDYTEIEKNINGIFSTIALVTGLPISYLTGILSSSLSGNHYGELVLKKDSIFNFFKVEVIPFLEGLKINYNRVDMSILKKASNFIDVIKELPDAVKIMLIEDSGLKQDIINYYKNNKS